MGRMHGKVVQSIFNLHALPTYHASFLTRQYGVFKPHEGNDFDRKVISDLATAIGIATGDDIDVSSLEATPRRV